MHFNEMKSKETKYLAHEDENELIYHILGLRRKSLQHYCIFLFQYSSDIGKSHHRKKANTLTPSSGIAI